MADYSVFALIYTIVFFFNRKVYLAALYKFFLL